MTFPWIELFGSLAAWTTLVGGFFAYLIKLMIRTALGDFLIQLHSTFAENNSTNIRFENLERRIAILESIQLARAKGE